MLAQCPAIPAGHDLTQTDENLPMMLAQWDEDPGIMSEYTLSMLVYFPLQVASLALLPKWWRLAAAAALLVMPEIICERVAPGYMSEVFIVMFVIFACAYLMLVWIVLGITLLIQRLRRTAAANQSQAADGRTS